MLLLPSPLLFFLLKLLLLLLENRGISIFTYCFSVWRNIYHGHRHHHRPHHHQIPGQYELKESLRLDNKQHIYITTTNHHTHSHPYVIHIWRLFIIMMPNYAIATKAAVTFLRWKIVWMVNFFRFFSLEVGYMHACVYLCLYYYEYMLRPTLFSRFGPFSHTMGHLHTRGSGCA